MKGLPSLDVFQRKLDAFVGSRAGTHGRCWPCKMSRAAWDREAELMLAVWSHHTIRHRHATPLLFGECPKIWSVAFQCRCFSPDSEWNVNALRYLQVGILVSCSLLQLNNVPFLRGERQDMDILVPLPVTNAHAELHQFCLGDLSCMSVCQDSIAWLFWAWFSSFS